MKTYVVLISFFFVIGCSSTRNVKVRTPISFDDKISSPSLLVDFNEKSNMPWNVGDLIISNTTTKDKDGATSSTTSINNSKTSMSSMWTIGMSYAAGILTVLLPLL